MRRDGSAEYRLKNEHNVMVTKQKADLEAMLDHLNIQVRLLVSLVLSISQVPVPHERRSCLQTENPCAILDQENAKLFLKGNPSDKYKFFLQSTDLYKMRTTYSKIDEETRAISDSTLKREKTKIATLQELMEEAEQRWEEAQSVRRLHLRVS